MPLLSVSIRKLLALLLGISVMGGGVLAEGTLEIHTIQTQPQVISKHQPFIVTVSGYNLGAFDSDYVHAAEISGTPPNFGNGVFAFEPYYDVEVSGQRVSIDYDGPGRCVTPVPPLAINTSPQLKRFRLPGLPEGVYTLSINYGIGCGDFFTQESAVLRVYAAENDLAFNFETPSDGSTVSGVGLIRGWACFSKSDYKAFEGEIIEEVAFKIDDGPLESLAFSTTREDTATVCGETNIQTGFGKTIFWGNYGSGEHSITFFIDGEEVDTRNFAVEAPPGGFLKGLEVEYVLQDFPDTERSVRVRWSEADQNFVIVEY